MMRIVPKRQHMEMHHIVVCGVTKHLSEQYSQSLLDSVKCARYVTSILITSWFQVSHKLCIKFWYILNLYTNFYLYCQVIIKKLPKT